MYPSNSERIKLIDQSNPPVSAARLDGLLLATQSRSPWTTPRDNCNIITGSPHGLRHQCFSRDLRKFPRDAPSKAAIAFNTSPLNYTASLQTEATENSCSHRMLAGCLGSQTHGPPGANVFVFHIPNEWTEAELACLFSRYGTLVSVRITTDKVTNRRLGFGFVSYTTIAAAAAAIKHLNGFPWNNKRLKVAIKRGEEQYALLHNAFSGTVNRTTNKPVPINHFDTSKYGGVVFRSQLSSPDYPMDTSSFLQRASSLGVSCTPLSPGALESRGFLSPPLQDALSPQTPFLQPAPTAPKKRSMRAGNSPLRIPTHNFDVLIQSSNPFPHLRTSNTEKIYQEGNPGTRKFLSPGEPNNIEGAVFSRDFDVLAPANSNVETFGTNATASSEESSTRKFGTSFSFSDASVGNSDPGNAHQPEFFTSQKCNAKAFFRNQQMLNDLQHRLSKAAGASRSSIFVAAGTATTATTTTASFSSGMGETPTNRGGYTTQTSFTGFADAKLQFHRKASSRENIDSFLVAGNTADWDTVSPMQFKAPQQVENASRQDARCLFSSQEEVSSSNKLKSSPSMSGPCSVAVTRTHNCPFIWDANAMRSHVYFCPSNHREQENVEKRNEQIIERMESPEAFAESVLNELTKDSNFATLLFDDTKTADLDIVPHPEFGNKNRPRMSCSPIKNENTQRFPSKKNGLLKSPFTPVEVANNESHTASSKHFLENWELEIPAAGSAVDKLFVGPQLQGGRCRPRKSSR